MKARKDAYYFSHDSNAKDDPKCVLLIEQLGLEGYGIFWVLVEILRDQPDYKYPIKLIPALSRKYNTTTEKVKTVITSYGLFSIENERFFFSESLNRRMEIFIKAREQKSIAGTKGNEIRWKQKKIASQSQSDHKAIASKVNERKEKNILLFEEVKEEEDLLESNPPEDGIERNWLALKGYLEKFNASKKEINSIVLLSNYGAIGNHVWKSIVEIRNNIKIHSPAAFIISQLKGN